MICYYQNINKQCRATNFQQYYYSSNHTLSAVFLLRMRPCFHHWWKDGLFKNYIWKVDFLKSYLSNRYFKMFKNSGSEHIPVDVILYTLYTGWQTIFMYNFSVYICTQNTFLKISFKGCSKYKVLEECWMGIFYFCTALPWGSCVKRKMGPPTSYFPDFFFF